MKATDRFLYTSMKDTDTGIVPKIMTNITVRDHIAIEAMDSIAMFYVLNKHVPGENEFITACYVRADAMIKESEK